MKRVKVQQHYVRASVCMRLRNSCVHGEKIRFIFFASSKDARPHIVHYTLHCPISYIQQHIWCASITSFSNFFTLPTKPISIRRLRTNSTTPKVKPTTTCSITCNPVSLSIVALSTLTTIAHCKAQCPLAVSHQFVYKYRVLPFFCFPAIVMPVYEYNIIIVDEKVAEYYTLCDTNLVWVNVQLSHS